MSEFTLERYTLWTQNMYLSDKECDKHRFQMVEDIDGHWVRWEEVKPLLQAYLAFINERNDDLSITKVEVLK